MTIHKEGYPSILISAALLYLLNTGVGMLFEEILWLRIIIAIPSLVLFFLIVYFFRSPSLTVDKLENGVLCPADGKVVVIEEFEESEYFNEKRIQVSIFMSPLNVHINRYPIDGKIKYFKHHNGSFHVAWHPKSSTENEHTSTVVEGKNGVEILFKQIAGAVARRIVSYAEEGTSIDQGSQCGFIKFGSRVDVLLPLNSKVKVKIGDKVKGGVTHLAELN